MKYQPFYVHMHMVHIVEQWLTLIQLATGVSFHIGAFCFDARFALATFILMRF